MKKLNLNQVISLPTIQTREFEGSTQDLKLETFSTRIWALRKQENNNTVHPLYIEIFCQSLNPESTHYGWEDYTEYFYRFKKITTEEAEIELDVTH